MSEYNIQMNRYNALNAEYDQLYPQPMKHASTHAKDGDDPITPSSIGAAELGADGKVLASQLPSMEVDAYTKAQTLSDTTKTLFGLDATAVPDDVFRIIHEMFLESLSVETGTYVGTGGQTTVNFSKTPKVVLINGYTYATRGSTTGNLSNMTIVMPHGIPAISFGDYYAGLNNTISLTWDGTSLSFNSDKMSRAGSTYQYAAFL